MPHYKNQQYAHLIIFYSAIFLFYLATKECKLQLPYWGDNDFI